MLTVLELAVLHLLQKYIVICIVNTRRTMRGWMHKHLENLVIDFIKMIFSAKKVGPVVHSSSLVQ